MEDYLAFFSLKNKKIYKVIEKIDWEQSFENQRKISYIFWQKRKFFGLFGFLENMFGVDRPKQLFLKFLKVHKKQFFRKRIFLKFTN